MGVSQAHSPSLGARGLYEAQRGRPNYEVGGGRTAWKAVATEREAQHHSDKPALEAQIRELEGGGGGEGARAVAEGATEGAE